MDWTASFQPQWVVSLLPPISTTPWEEAQDLADAGLAARDPIILISASRSAIDAPLPWLPYLAEERSVDEFTSSWPEERRRAVVAGSFGMHQVKGTRPAFEKAVTPMGYQIRVAEWFEASPKRQANTFRLSVTIDSFREWLGGDRSAIIRVANKSKNLHTKLEAIEFRRETPPASVFVGGYARRVRTIRVGQLPKIDTIRINATVYVGAAQIRRRTIRIGARP